MNILAFQTNIPHRALEIYVAGCSRHCEGCHNPQTWDFDIGTPYNEYDVERAITQRMSRMRTLDSIWVLGGEPLDSDIESVCNLLKVCKRHLTGELILFTSYSFGEQKDKALHRVFEYATWVKTGTYKPFLDMGDAISYREGLPAITLASNNQRLISRAEYMRSYKDESVRYW